ncbi:MAG: pirin family protein [Kiritimatiellae bacterium]|nr:pirin family protein [Kiritimatiellia bacterium]
MNATLNILKATDTADGDGARIKRLFPAPELMHYDPFVLLDEFFVDPTTGFPTHPHRGFEAVTYMLDGSFRHTDNLGNDSEVGAGGVQRFTAGSGLEHSEMPGPADRNHGFQLWVNLPRHLKGLPPSYQQVNPAAIPEDRQDWLTVRTVVGPGSPVALNTEVTYLDVRIENSRAFPVWIPDGHRGILYCYAGAFTADGAPVRPGHALFLEDMSSFTVRAAPSTRFVLISGKPHGEPIRLHGPFVD